MLTEHQSAPVGGKILVLGASGMLGHTLLRYLIHRGMPCVGTVRSAQAYASLPLELQAQTVIAGDLTDAAVIARLLDAHRPDVVINCVGIVKQSAEAADPLVALPINALLPHLLARACAASGARLVHVSTDCVFTGTRGHYAEGDAPDARDLYGLSKALGEVDAPHALTLRTSIIGPELVASPHGLLGWFLAQHGEVRGFTRAFFSGLPTVEFARVVVDFVLPRPALHGVYHVAAEAISKHDLLVLIAEAYHKDNTIHRDDKLAIDRSLDGSRFAEATGYKAPSWPALVAAMKEFG